MIKVNELTANISTHDKNKIGLNSAKTVDKITGNVLEFEFDYFTIDKVTEFIAINDGSNEEETYYFIRVDGVLRLVSEQAYNLIRNLKLKNMKIVKGETIPSDLKQAQNYINMFYVYPNQF